VKKDAGLLDAFGKGASADIQLAKEELYAQVVPGCFAFSRARSFALYVPGVCPPNSTAMLLACLALCPLTDDLGPSHQYVHALGAPAHHATGLAPSVAQAGARRLAARHAPTPLRWAFRCGTQHRVGSEFPRILVLFGLACNT
jgi:hypothetical protein